jgi:hypothetical protein
MRLTARLSLVALFLLCWTTRTGQAGPLNITSGTGLTGTGAYTGTFDYSDTDATSATLTVTLKNTSAAAFLTAFAFNNPDNQITDAQLKIAPSGFLLLGTAPFQNGVIASPYGKFDIGAGVGTDWESGNNSSSGIAVGGSGVFTFKLTGKNLDKLSATSFADTKWSSPNGGHAPELFVARFHGGKSDKDADKVPSGLTDPGGVTITGHAAPEPGSLTLAGLGISCLLARGWRRRKAPPQ